MALSTCGRARAHGRANLRYQSAYLFGAVCPVRGAGAVLITPKDDRRGAKTNQAASAAPLEPLDEAYALHRRS